MLQVENVLNIKCMIREPSDHHNTGQMKYPMKIKEIIIKKKMEANISYIYIYLLVCSYTCICIYIDVCRFVLKAQKKEEISDTELTFRYCKDE